MLYKTGFIIAEKHFPFGVGFGRLSREKGLFTLLEAVKRTGAKLKKTIIRKNIMRI